MAIRSSTQASRLTRDKAQRRVALATAVSLLLVALLPPFAQFAVLKSLIRTPDRASAAAAS